MKDNFAVIGADVIGEAIARTLLARKHHGQIIATRREVEKLEDLKKLGSIYDQR